jgi:FkbM family methyltransferase
MINNSKENKYKVLENIYNVFNQDLLPAAHIEFLELLKSDYNTDFKVIYDIGSCVMHWQRHANRIWRADIYCFDAFTPLVELYKKENVKFDNVLLYSDDNCKIKFYQNDHWYGGNSIYKENNRTYFPENNYLIKETITLDTLVEQKQYPYPDLIKIDAQGSELDIIKGASKCLENATHLIIEIVRENIEYNIGSPKRHEVIDYLKNIGYLCLCPAFSGNPADDDFCFINYRKMKSKV